MYYHFSTPNFIRNPMGMSIWPNTNPKYKYKYKYHNLKCSVLVLQQCVLPFFHSKFLHKSNGHVHLTKCKSQIQIQIPNSKNLKCLVLVIQQSVLPFSTSHTSILFCPTENQHDKKLLRFFSDR